MNTRTLLSLMLTAGGLLLLGGCFDSELKEVKINAVTGHLISLPVTTDTTQSFQVTSNVWVSDIDSVLFYAGLDPNEISAARPIIAQVSLLSPESSLSEFKEFSCYIQNNNTITLVAALEEEEPLSSTQDDLFVLNTDRREAFFSDSSTILLEYQRSSISDTIWTIELLMLWELTGSI